jgi:hypothetical protein
MNTPTIASGRLLVGVLAAASLLLATAPAPTAAAYAQDDRPGDPPAAIDWAPDDGGAAADTALVRPKNFGRAAFEVFLANAVVWSFDRYIREGGTNPVFRIGFNSWEENLVAGYNWDDNQFSTNQLSHPYHGNLYYNAARSNGFSYWESVPFTFAGSFMWEYFGEVHHPAMNDWIATSVGGVALGEITHRLATIIRDNEATGSERTWRETGGLLVDPMGGLNRIIDGDWSRQGLNPPKRYPKNYRSRLDVGLRTRGEERLWEADTTDVHLGYEFEYGDPFFGDMGEPFDTFDFSFELYFGDKSKIGDVQGSGNLAGMFLKETDRVSHILAAYHRYDYINTNALEFGGQSLTAALLSRFETDGGTEVRTELHLGSMILGGASSDYENVSGRSYDFGPGAVMRFEASLGRGGWRYFELGHDQFFLHSISGNVVDHHLSRTRLSLDVPVKYNVGLGLEYRLTLAERRYRDYPDVSRRNPESRVFLRWILN